MIKIPKKLLFNPPFSSLKYSSLKPLFRIFFPAVFFTLLPVILNFYVANLTIKLLFFYYVVLIFIAVSLLRSYLRRIYRLKLMEGDLEEKINLAGNEELQENNNYAALREKFKRYKSLKQIIEELNQNLSLDSLAETLVDIVFKLVALKNGTCIFYLVDNQVQKLTIFKTRKENSEQIIKAKEGDVFDAWVLRQASSLLIENARRDFRFDPEKIFIEQDRQIASLISAPLVAEHRLLGILRLDSPKASAYSQDDLRFLSTISELGAVALENAQLFSRTQELAIHDDLTKLFTKGHFMQRLKQEYRRAQRTKNDLSLLMLDIDDFKKYNDQFGHSAGDIVLKKIAAEMDDFLKDYHPLISRFGGEEFCILLSRIDKKRVCDIAKELCKKIEKTKVILRRKETGITISIGVADLLDAPDEEGLVFKADQALLKAKKKGKNCVVCA